jgi:transposase
MLAKEPIRVKSIGTGTPRRMQPVPLMRVPPKLRTVRRAAGQASGTSIRIGASPAIDLAALSARSSRRRAAAGLGSVISKGPIQELRDRTRLRKALAEDRRRWGQRLHAYLLHEGWPCSRSNLLRPPGLRWAAALKLPEHARPQVDSLLAVMAALETQLETVDAELRRFARADERCRALQSIYGIGPILACHLLAEIGEARRFRHSEQITRLAGLDPVVDESGETRRGGHLAKAGSPHLRWALVEAAVHVHRPSAPDLALHRATRQRRDTTVARLTVAARSANAPSTPCASSSSPQPDRTGPALTRSPFRLSPALAALHFGMSRLSPPRLDNLRRKPRAPR